ncbi:MAG: hypothetical protein Q4C47_01465 [Planctomycetia bacterium]|nr:hypothetical protein [Planctomycetia bacterium]
MSFSRFSGIGRRNFREETGVSHQSSGRSSQKSSGPVAPETDDTGTVRFWYGIGIVWYEADPTGSEDEVSEDRNRTVRKAESRE